MTSKELIAILEKYPPDMLVELYDWNERYAGSTSFEEKDIFFCEGILTLGIFDDES